MAVVNVNPGESIESALRRFKRKVMTEEIIKDAKKHAFFMPPGQKAKLKSALARKRNKKKAVRGPVRLIEIPACSRLTRSIKKT
jgi:small subunit ribosomal protein S21